MKRMITSRLSRVSLIAISLVSDVPILPILILSCACRVVPKGTVGNLNNMEGHDLSFTRTVEDAVVLLRSKHQAMSG